MRQRRIFTLASLALALMAGACAKDIAITEPRPISFAQESAFTLPGSAITVEDVAPSMAPLPSVEAIEGRTPADIVRAFARDRLRASGGEGRVVVRILEANVVEEGLSTQYGFAGRLGGEQDRQFTGKIKVEILLYGPKQKGPGNVSAEASASRPLAASIGPNGSSVEYDDLIQVLGRDFDGALAAQLSGYQAGL
jgi:hypothetical protein